MAISPDAMETLRAAGERVRAREIAAANRPRFRDLVGEPGRCLAIVEGEPGPDARCCGDPVEARGLFLGRYCAGCRARLLAA